MACCAINSGASCSATLFMCQHGAVRPQNKNTQITPRFDISPPIDFAATAPAAHVPGTIEMAGWLCFHYMARDFMSSKKKEKKTDQTEIT